MEVEQCHSTATKFSTLQDNDAESDNAENNTADSYSAEDDNDGDHEDDNMGVRRSGPVIRFRVFQAHFNWA